MTSINDLNNDCLREILLNVEVNERINLRKVCKKWCNVVDDCWREVRNVTIFNAVSTDTNHIRPGVTGTHHVVLIKTSGQKLIEGVMKRCGDVIKFLIENREGKNNSVVPVGMKYCSNIEQLIITVCTKVEDKNASQFIAVNKKLRALFLKIKFNNAKVCFRKIPTNCLENLQFWSCYCDYPSTATLFGQKQVVGRCSSLKKLSVDYFDDELVKLVGQKTTLEVLQLVFYHSKGVTGRGLYHILELKNLKYLVLKTTPGSTPQQRRLRHFSVPVTDDFLMALAENLPLLGSLCIEAPAHVTNRGFKSLASLERLRKLNIIDCPGITDEFLVLFSGLEELSLVNCPIRDEGVIKLLKEAETLRLLDLGETLITNKTLVAAHATKTRRNGIALHLYPAGIVITPNSR